MPKKNKQGGIDLSALDLDLLTVLRGEELYGLELLDRINHARQQVEMNKLGIGSLYPTLKRMEKAGLIEGEFREPVAEEGSPRRKYYRLLGEGEIAISRTQAYRRLLAKDKNKSMPKGKRAITLLNSIPHQFS
ncbi:MAG: helix-turn-helix transcriptional regulator [Cyanobacteria bacterium J06621_8]